MKWTQYSLKTLTEATDMISYTLGEIGVEGIEIEDHIPLTDLERKQMYIDIVPETVADDGTAIIRFYRDPDENIENFKLEVQSALDELREFIEIGPAILEISETADKDWMNNWKEFFHAFRVSDRLVIKPTWEETLTLPCTSDRDIILSIDPGPAFGTGSHETTKLCILALEKYILPDMTILDVGSGSGILSIASIKYGAKKAVGIEIDEFAIPSALENRAENNISNEQFELIHGNLLDDATLQQNIGTSCYDIAVANILANVIIPLSNEIGQHIKPGGLFISSGIINTAAEDVRNAIISAHFEIIETTTLGEWFCFVAKKK